MVTMLTGIAIDQSINTNKDARPACTVLEGIDPISVVVRLLDTHDQV
jgi:hypothetical protein